MPSNRIGRINEEIQRELAALIRTVKDPRVHGLVSITAVDTTSDLRYAKIYVSVLDKSDVGEVVKGLKSAGGYLRRELRNGKVSLQLRVAAPGEQVKAYSKKEQFQMMLQRSEGLQLLRDELNLTLA